MSMTSVAVCITVPLAVHWPIRRMRENSTSQSLHWTAIMMSTSWTSSLWSALRPVTTSASLETSTQTHGSSLTVWPTESVSINHVIIFHWKYNDLCVQLTRTTFHVWLTALVSWMSGCMRETRTGWSTHHQESYLSWSDGSLKTYTCVSMFSLMSPCTEMLKSIVTVQVSV